MPVKSKKNKGLLDTVKGKLGIGNSKPEEKTAAQIITENRSRADALVAKLENLSASAGKGEYVGREEDGSDSVDAIRNKVYGMSLWLRNSPSIFDDMAEFDELLHWCADALAAGLKEGRYNKVKGAITALSSGILYWRDNVPPDKLEYKAEVLQERINYMKKFKALIQLYDVIDQKSVTISKLNDELKNDSKELLDEHEEIQTFLKTPEGMELYGRIKKYENMPGQLIGTEAGDLMVRFNSVSRFAHNVSNKMTIRQGEVTEYDLRYAQSEDIRVDLYINKPDLYNPELSALHAQVLSQTCENVAKQLADAAQFIDTITNYDAKLQNILSNADAQKVNNHGLSYVERVILGNNTDTAEAVKLGSKVAQRIKEAELRAAEAKRLAEEEWEKAKDKLSSVDQNIAMAVLGNVNFSVNTDENINENKNENQNYNYNT